MIVASAAKVHQHQKDEKRQEKEDWKLKTFFDERARGFSLSEAVGFEKQDLNVERYMERLKVIQRCNPVLCRL